jgi:hypothetical protein
MSSICHLPWVEMPPFTSVTSSASQQGHRDGRTATARPPLVRHGIVTWSIAHSGVRAPAVGGGRSARLAAVGYICSYCGEGLPEDVECPCQAIGDDLHDAGPGRAAKREQDRRRESRMRANGPVESFTAAEVGKRDGTVAAKCWMWPDRPSSCDDCRRKELGVAWLLRPLAPGLAPGLSGVIDRRLRQLVIISQRQPGPIRRRRPRSGVSQIPDLPPAPAAQTA